MSVSNQVPEIQELAIAAQEHLLDPGDPAKAKRLENALDALGRPSNGAQLLWHQPHDEWLMDIMDTAKFFGTEDPIVEGLLYRRSLTLLTANNNAGKTLAAMQAGVDVAFGAPGRSVWTHSHMPLKQRGRVLMCVGEGGAGLHKRIRAMLQEMNVTYEPGWFAASPRVPVFCDTKTAGQYANEWMEFISALRKQAATFEPDVIILDHLSRASVGANENAADEMTPVMAAIRKMAEELNCAVLILHHTNKGKEEPRGSSAIMAEVDVAFVMEKLEDVDNSVVSAMGKADKRVNAQSSFVRLFCTKQREAAYPADLDGVIIGANTGELNGQGKPVTGGFISWYSNGAFKSVGVRLKTQELLLWWQANPDWEGKLTELYEENPIHVSKKMYAQMLEVFLNKGAIVAEKVGRSYRYRLAKTP